MALKGEIVKEYLRKFQKTQTRTLAKKIYEENKTVFKDSEDVRNVIRFYRNSRGEKARACAGERFETPIPFNLPESDETIYDPYVIPTTQNKILIIGDLHIPYHSISAISACFSWGLEHGINTILINGDLIDCHLLSNFMKDPRKRKFKQELELTKQFFDALQNTFPNAKVYYKEGNHEFRLQAYLMTHAPHIFDCEEYHLPVLLQLASRGIEWIQDKRIIHAGKLNILHGHELRITSNTVNPARSTFLKTKESTLVDHSHQTSEHSEPSLNGDLITCWSSGCLSELHPEYAPINKWNHGFSRVVVEKDKTFKVTNIRIKDGKIY